MKFQNHKLACLALTLVIILSSIFSLTEYIKYKNSLSEQITYRVPVDITPKAETAILGDGNINTIDQWKYDGTNITQRVASRPIKITGLSISSNICTDSSGILTTSGCVSGGGGSGGGTFSTSTVNGLLVQYPYTNLITSLDGSATTTSDFWFDPFISKTFFSYGSSTGYTTGNLYVTSPSQGYAYLGTNGRLNTVATTTLAGQVFPFTSNTGYNSTSTAIGFTAGLFSLSSTTLNGLKLTDLSQGWTYVGSNGLVQTTSTSSLANFILPFTSYGASTSTTIGFTGGLFSTASSTFSSNLFLSSLGQGFLYTGSNGLVNRIASSSIQLSWFNNDLANLSATDSTLTFSGSYNGSVARTVGLNLSNPNTWTGLQTFSNSTTSLASFTYASSTSWYGGGLTSCSNSTTDKLLYNSSTGLFSCGTDQTTGGGSSPGGSNGNVQYNASGSFGGVATTTLTFSGFPSALSGTLGTLIGGSNSTLTWWGLSTSSNLTVGQSIYATGNNTVASVATSSIASNSSITVTNGSSAYVLGSQPSFAINTANTNTWTALQNFNYSSSTIYSSFQTSSTTSSTDGSLDVLSIFKLPVSSAPTLGTQGRLALDSTSNNLILATSTSGHFVVASATTTLYSFTASTTALVSGTNIDMPSKALPQVVTAIWCKVSGGTSLVINLSDGTNDTNTVTCTTTGAQYAITSNNTWTADEAIRLEIGTKTGDTGYLTVDVRGYRTSD